MAKQIRKFIGLSLLLAAVSASGQVRHAVQIKVPFPFVAAEKNWPAAVYQVEVAPENGILTLRTPDSTPATMLTTSDERSGDNKAHLLFRCSGDRWVLQEFTLDGTARILPVGQLQKEQAELQPSCDETVVASGISIH